MKELFLYLCGFSVVTSIAVIVAVLLRPVLKKGPSYIRCILWALVFLRLMIPVGFVGIPFSVPDPFTAAPQTVSVPQNEGKPTEDPVTDNSTAQSPVQEHMQSPAQTPAQSPTQDPAQSPTQTPTQDPVQNPTQETPGQTPTQTPANDMPAHGDPVAAPVTNQAEPQGESGVDVLSVVSVVWACGVVVLLGYMLASSLLLRYRVGNAIVYDSRIRIIDKDCSPFVSGIFRPMIYVPASVDKKDWPYIIAHETSHIKRFDHVLKPLAFLVLCFYWFNPLIWVAYLLLNKDIEYACDERTVKHMENQDRKAYSLALLSVSQGENIIFAPPLSFGRVGVKERIKGVMKKRVPIWAICLAMIICVSLSLLMACTPGSKAATDSETSSEEIESSESENSVGSAVELEVLVEYADSDELDDNSLFFKDDDYELIKVSVNKEVKNFKFIEVAYDEETTDPYAGKTLFEVASLTPDRPFYVKTFLNDILSFKGISFEDENGKTVCYRISYNVAYEMNWDLWLDPIPSEPPKQNEESESSTGNETSTGSESSSEPPEEFPEVPPIGHGIFADYADDSELHDDSLLFDEGGYTLVKIRVTEEVKNFKFITVIDGAVPYAGETLFEVASLTPDRPFYARTNIGEGFSERGISFVNENGETVCCQINYDGRGGSGFGLQPIPGNPDSQGEEPIPKVSGIFADYADESELHDDSLFFEEDIYSTLVKIWVTEEVKNFKFITVIDGAVPYAGETLFEVASLTPDRPFYAKAKIGEGFSERGISYVNQNGETVYCRIEYDGRGGGPTGFGLLSIPGPSESFFYKVNPSLPVYMVTVVYTDGQKQTAEQIIVTEQETGKEIQRITVDDDRRDDLQSAYVADVTFDGYADLLVSRQSSPVSSTWLYAYVWDAETNQLVYAPGFEELSNVALDVERKQILHHGIADSITYYGICIYDPEKKEFVVQRDLYWDCDWYEAGLTCFTENEQKNGKWETVNAFTFSGATPDPEDPRVKPYYEEGSVWDLGSSKWLEYVCSD